MTQVLVLIALMAVIFVQLAQAQLPPLPTIPPITIPPITIPPLPLPALPVVPTVTLCPAGYFAIGLLCYACPTGTTSAAGDLACSACPFNKYAPGPGNAFCSTCGPNTIPSLAADVCICGQHPKSKAGKLSAGSPSLAPALLPTLPTSPTGLVGTVTGGSGGLVPGVTGGSGGLVPSVTGGNPTGSGGLGVPLLSSAPATPSSPTGTGTGTGTASGKTGKKGKN